jgi:hypothetical protein
MTVNSSSWLGDYIYSMLMFHHISECHERHHEGYTHGQASGNVDYVGSSQHRDSPFSASAALMAPGQSSAYGLGCMFCYLPVPVV